MLLESGFPMAVEGALYASAATAPKSTEPPICLHDGIHIAPVVALERRKWRGAKDAEKGLSF